LAGHLSNRLPGALRHAHVAHRGSPDVPPSQSGFWTTQPKVTSDGRCSDDRAVSIARDGVHVDLRYHRRGREPIAKCLFTDSWASSGEEYPHRGAPHLSVSLTRLVGGRPDVNHLSRHTGSRRDNRTTPPSRHFAANAEYPEYKNQHRYVFLLHGLRAFALVANEIIPGLRNSAHTSLSHVFRIPIQRP